MYTYIYMDPSWENIKGVHFFLLRTELNLSNAGLVPCGPDGKWIASV